MIAVYDLLLLHHPCLSLIARIRGSLPLCMCAHRVLYLAMSPDGQSIVTGAGDETLRFWNVFPSPKSMDSGEGHTGLLFPAGPDIR